MKKKELDSVQNENAKDEGNEKSPEYLAFENFAKKILSVPKEELDRRERTSKDPPHSPR
jgi:hypothetical protein